MVKPVDSCLYLEENIEFFEKTPKQKHLNMNVCGVKYEKIY